MIKQHKRFRVKEYLTNADRVVFIFTAFGTKLEIYRPFTSALVRRGYSAVIYDYPVSIVKGAEISEWHAFYQDVLADVKSRIDVLAKNGYVDFYSHGTSIGTLLASLVSRNCPEVTHTVLNLPYGDFSNAIYTIHPARTVKDKLLDQGVSQEMFADAFAYLDPLKTAAQFKDKNVLLFISKADKILDYDDVLRTKHALEQSGAKLTYVENRRLGHFVGGAKNILDMKKLIKFLES